MRTHRHARLQIQLILLLAVFKAQTLAGAAATRHPSPLSIELSPYLGTLSPTRQLAVLPGQPGGNAEKLLADDDEPDAGRD